MTTAAAAPLSPAALLDQQAGDAQRYRALLHELMDMGMALVRAVPKQVAAEAGGEEPAAPAGLRDAAVAFDLLSRAVRRTVALARKVAEPLPQRPDPARRWTVREAEDMSQRPDSELGPDLDAEAAEAFRAELCERLDSLDLDDEGGRRPIEDVIAGICRDLGFGRFLGGPPARGAPPDTRALGARATEPSAAPGSAAPAPAAARPVEPQPGLRPCTPEFATELMHGLLARQNE